MWEEILMENLNFDEFIKKYGIAITGLSKRIGDNNGKLQHKTDELARRLYQDATENKVDMSDMTRAIANFYQGDILGQVKMNKYVERYK
jgi:hypothetical protein